MVPVWWATHRYSIPCAILHNRLLFLSTHVPCTCPLQLSPCLSSQASLLKVTRRTMAPKRKPRGKAKARCAPPPPRVAQVQRSNERQKQRRQALKELNALTVELGMAASSLRLERDEGSNVEKRVRLLQRRCPDASSLARLRAAAQRYTGNGGTFSAPVLDEEEHGPMELPYIAKHTVLKPTFRLCSEAFMLTYHSRLFTELTWPLFMAFVKAMLPRLGCRAWAACIERGTLAETSLTCKRLITKQHNKGGSPCA